MLIANRGEIARRIIRTCRRLGIATVAVYTDADADAPYVAEADVAVHLPGNAPAETYLRVDRSLDAAARDTAATRSTPATASSPRTPASPAPCIDAGLTWIGPPPAAIAAMGSKIGPRR